MDKPRVIFLNRVYAPSTEATAQLLTDLAEGLAARGWSVHVIAAGDGATTKEGVTIHRTGGTDRHGGLLSRALNYGRFRRAAQTLLGRLIQPGDIIVPMTDPPLLSSAVTGLVLARGGHLVPWIQDIYPEILSAHLGAWTTALLRPLRNRRNRSWLSARHCVTLGEEMAQALTHAGVPDGRISLVPNWAPRELHTPATADAVAKRRESWGVADKFVLAYSGNLGRVHEFNAVIEAAARLRGHRPIVFLFIGRGSRFDEVKAAAQARGLDNVKFLPPEPRATLADSLAAADAHLVTLQPAFSALVYPSKLAGVLAAGRPVLFVGPPDGEIARLLANEQCGVAVGPDEGERLAATIGVWQTAPAHRAELGRHARTVYEQRYTFVAALTQWESILRQAAARP